MSKGIPLLRGARLLLLFSFIIQQNQYPLQSIHTRVEYTCANSSNHRLLFIGFFSFGNGKKSQGTQCGENGAFAFGFGKQIANKYWYVNYCIMIMQNELRCHTFHTKKILENWMAWADQYINILGNFLNSHSMIFKHNLFYCFKVFKAFWHGCTSRSFIIINQRL